MAKRKNKLKRTRRYSNMLQFKDQDEIALPDWIGGTSLTLAEIGAIVCLAGWQNGSPAPEVAERIGSEEMAGALQSLKEKGVLQMKLEGERLAMELDLDKVVPRSLELPDGSPG